MLVVRAIPESVAAVGPARDEDREFGVERDAGFGNRGLLADRCPCGLGLAAARDPGLALAVIAVAAALEHQRRAERRDRCLDIGAGLRPRARARPGRRSVR